MRVKVISYNLHKGRCRRNRSDILDEAARALAARTPDVLVCQEVFHGLEHGLLQSHFITQQLGDDHDHAFGPNAFYRQGCHGNATFARLPIGHRENRDITESFFERRGILRTTLHADAGDFDVLNTHFSLTGRQRRKQWQKLRECLPEDPLRPVVAAGDFNDFYGTLDRRIRNSGLLASAMWELSPRDRRTFPSHRPLFGLDRIYFRGFELENVRVLRGDPWSELSDHLPIEAVLRLTR